MNRFSICFFTYGMMERRVWILVLIVTQLFWETTTAVRDFPLSSNYNLKDFEVITIFNDLIAKHNPLNFGLGAPNFNPPETLKNALSQVAISNDTLFHQYGPSGGHPRLVKAVANFFSPLLKRTLNPNDNVAITVGGSAALYSIFQAFSEPGDEWIVFEPCYHMFVPMIKAARAVPKFVPLRLSKSSGEISAADFKYDRDELRKAFSNRTKGILVNTPHNPLGKIFTLDELTFIAELANQHDVIVIFDEVYQFLNYDGEEHIRLPTFPGMFDRTLTVGSAGKMFTATGYRVGWVYGPKDLVDKIKIVHTTIVLAQPAVLHEAVAIQLEYELANFNNSKSYLSTLRRDSESKRDRVNKILSNAGITPIRPQGGYFTVGNWTTMIDRRELDGETDQRVGYRFIRWLVKNVNIYGLPLSCGYGEEHNDLGEGGFRLTMIKDDETIEGLDMALKKWKMGRNEVRTLRKAAAM